MVTVDMHQKGDDWVCDVTVEHGGQRSNHTVRVAAGDLARWGRDDTAAAVEELVSRSFRFLLEREPSSAILTRFELSVIPRYFPEYDEQFKR